MSYEAVDCIDAGSEYCPCYLAETNNCLICSQLQGKEFCDCINWKGVCIYQEYIWNGGKRKKPREGISARVLEKKAVSDKTLFLKIKVSKTLSRELNQPGSYLFIREENHPDFFDVPMSVMYADENEGTLDLLLQIKGVKTKVLKDIGDSLSIRAPYWNGIIGLKNLKTVKDKKCVIVTRGIAQAPSVLVAKKLRFSGNDVMVFMDRGSCNTTYSRDYFERLGCSVTETTAIKNKAIDENFRLKLQEIMNTGTIGLVFSGGSDILHRGMLDIIKRSNNDIPFVCTNNANICCGEGVCGSCNIRLKDGRRIKACKAQVNPADMIGG